MAREPRRPSPGRARRDPLLEPLDSTDAELDRAAEITPEDLAMIAERAPAPVRKYLNAQLADIPRRRRGPSGGA